MSNRWSGANVRKARALLTRRMLAAERMGTPLLCSFYPRDPRCPGAVTTDQHWDVDHLVPRSEGGTVRDPNNWAPAHHVCNNRAGGALSAAHRKAGTKGVWAW